MRRFQARHGLTVDGVLRSATLTSMNVPAATRRDQLKVNISRLKTLTTNLGPRYVVANIPAARVEAIENESSVSRHTAVGRQARSCLARHQQQDRRDQFQSLLDRPGVDRAQGSDSEDAGRAGLPDQEPHPHPRQSKHGELQPSQINWYSEDAAIYIFKQDPGSLNSLGSYPHQFPLRLRRVHARHAAQEPVRRRFPFPFIGLHAGPERAPTGHLVARRNQGMVARRRSIGCINRATQGMPGCKARAVALGLCHRVVGVRWHRAIPRRYLQPRRSRRAGDPGHNSIVSTIARQNPA